MTSHPKRIYRIWLNESIKKHAIVVSKEELNRGDGCNTVLLTTNRVAERSRYEHCVFFAAGEFGLTEDCVAQCESIGATYYEHFADLDPIGTISDEKWEELVAAMGCVMDAACYVP